LPLERAGQALCFALALALARHTVVFRFARSSASSAGARDALSGTLRLVAA